ncbi:uncharacterized protein NPIL_112761 [Nephila pilipes]|uniref:Uncharacterized protein n=1 Tax=Nephila pilipes TaxID=299642 RepID=A0A8X6N1M5_NEPPI|nr:uncharacterized protein NPIL_570321 [Nephila pilipes]GFU29813.1 uncharacterized protein NPIL_112761 [Nephila pilipes]
MSSRSTANKKKSSVNFFHFPNLHKNNSISKKGKNREILAGEIKREETRFRFAAVLIHSTAAVIPVWGCCRAIMSALEVTFELLVVLIKTLGTVCVSIFRCIIPEPLKSVRERVILVTGSAGGLGRQIAQKLALLGARVVLVDVDEVSPF